MKYRLLLIIYNISIKVPNIENYPVYLSCQND